MQYHVNRVVSRFRSTTVCGNQLIISAQIEIINIQSLLGRSVRDIGFANAPCRIIENNMGGLYLNVKFGFTQMLRHL